MHERLIPMEADTLDELAQAFIFMTASVLEKERAIIHACIGSDIDVLHGGHDPIELGDAFSAACPFAEQPNHDVLLQAISLLTASQTAHLGESLDQIRKALVGLPQVRGVDFDPTNVFAVPPLWHQRWGLILSGALYPAYVGFVDWGQY